MQLLYSNIGALLPLTIKSAQFSKKMINYKCFVWKSRIREKLNMFVHVMVSPFESKGSCSFFLMKFQMKSI